MQARPVNPGMRSDNYHRTNATTRPCAIYGHLEIADCRASWRSRYTIRFPFPTFIRIFIRPAVDAGSATNEACRATAWLQLNAYAGFARHPGKLSAVIPRHEWRAPLTQRPLVERTFRDRATNISQIFRKKDRGEHSVRTMVANAMRVNPTRITNDAALKMQSSVWRPLSGNRNIPC